MTNYRLVFLHGWGGSAESLRPLAKELKHQIRNLEPGEPGKINKPTATIQVLELPGFGDARQLLDQLGRPWHLSDYRQWVLDTVLSTSTAKSDEQLVLIGHSFGGKILLSLLANGYLPATARIVLINASGLQPRLGRKQRLLRSATKALKPITVIAKKLRLQGFLEFARRAFYKFIVGARDYERLHSDPLLQKTFLNIIAEHITPTSLSQVENQVLLIWGEQDRATPLWMGQTLAKFLPHSQLRTFPEATHGLPLHQPAEVAKVIVDEFSS